MNQIIAKLFSGQGLPVMPVMTHPGIDLIGKDVLDAVRDGQVHADAILALRRKYPGAAASTTIMDLSVEAEAFGAQVVFQPGEVPTVTGRLLQSAQDVADLKVPGLDAARVPQYLKAIRIASSALKGEVSKMDSLTEMLSVSGPVVQALDCPLFGGCIGPFSLAGRLYDMTELMMAMFMEPDTVHALLEKCTAFLLEYVRAIKAAGAGGVVMAEPASGLLSGEDCTVYSSDYVKRIVDDVQDDSFAVILHNCGNQGQCTLSMAGTGAAALHFGNAIDMAGVLEQVPQDIAVMGNVDPVGIMKMALPAKVREAVMELRAKAAGHANFVLSTGCDVPPATPQHNIDAFFAAAASSAN